MGESDALIVAGYKAGHRKGVTLGCVRDVVHTHALDGLNYVWLWPVFGRVAWIDFDEPAGSNNWKTYGRYFFARHGAEISHDPKHLVDAHVKTFVDSKTKTIDLRFYFVSPRDGSIYVSSPTRLFYELEAQFFKRHGFCHPHHQPPSTENVIARHETEHEDMKGLAPYWPPWWVDRPVLDVPPPKHVPNISLKTPSKTIRRRMSKS